MDQDEVSEEQAAKNEIEVDGFCGEAEQKWCERHRSQKNARDERCAMAMVKVVTRFEVRFTPALAVERASVQQTVGGIEHPDGEEHREGRRKRQPDVVGGGDEPDPERCYRRGIEREEMP